MATKTKPQINHHLPIIIKYIITQKLDTTIRVDKAIEYFMSHMDDNVELEKFESFCGVGVTVSPEQIEKVVEKYLSDVKTELINRRYRLNFGDVMQKVRSELMWADGKAIKNEIDVQVSAFFKLNQ